MATECPFLGFQIEGPLVVDRRKYEAVTRRVHVTSQRLERMENGSWSLVVEHVTDNVRGKYRFYDIVETDRYRFQGHHRLLKNEIHKWAERQRKNRAKPRLDARGRLMKQLEGQIKRSYLYHDADRDSAKAMLASLQNEAAQ